MPADCMSAYIVVGPTNRKPRFRSAFEAAFDSAVVAGMSAKPSGRGRCAVGANDQSSASSSPGTIVVTSRALEMVASILARLRTIPASAMRRSMSD